MAAEAALIPIICAMLLGGEAEATRAYDVGGEAHRIRIDCETGTEAVEIGLDRRSSLDSVQQALFAASVTGKRPAVILVDTDGREGPFELRIRTAARAAGVRYESLHRDWLIRWRMTAYLRAAPRALPDGS